MTETPTQTRTWRVNTKIAAMSSCNETGLHDAVLE